MWQYGVVVKAYLTDAGKPGLIPCAEREKSKLAQTEYMFKWVYKLRFLASFKFVSVLDVLAKLC